MLKRIFGVIVAAYVVMASASAGDFTITDEDSGVVEVEYTGTVYRYDYAKWHLVEAHSQGRIIILTINTPGGSAFGGYDLYWAIEKTKNVVTVAGSYGAWSAGAVMWMAGDHRVVAPNGQVGWHRAYCQWDPWPNPDIGCDPIMSDIAMDAIFADAGYGKLFGAHLINIQNRFGTDGWIIATTDGWWVEDKNMWTLTKVDPEFFGVPPIDWRLR